MTMFPPPAGDITRTASWEAKNAARRVTDTSFSQLTSFSSSSVVRCPERALLSRMSSLPCCCATCRTIVCGAPAWLRSTYRNSADTPCRRSSVSVALPRFLSISAMTRRAPSRPNERAMFLPIPRALPVTSTTLSLKRPSFRCGGFSLLDISPICLFVCLLTQPNQAVLPVMPVDASVEIIKLCHQVFSGLKNTCKSLQRRGKRELITGT